jgi:M6 family metalloprotease-like protein
MKKSVLYLVLFFLSITLAGAPFTYLPHTITQPDGTEIACFVSGDEFFNWIHDAEGYSIIRGNDGFWYYATRTGEEITASSYRVNSVSPGEAGLEQWVKISRDEYLKRRKRLEIPVKGDAVKAPHAGMINNLVIYIRFSGESEIETTRVEYDDRLNEPKDLSLKTYFREVSYYQLTIESTHYPACSEPETTNASYEDSHPRGYFQPYDATTNPIGYQTETESRLREHQLLVDAINWINENDPVPAGLNTDMDDDGYVDNVCFMINGQSDGWSELLWAHRWALYTYPVFINGKRVWDYTFQPENQVSVKTLCHEMFHTLSAPDLYHYDDGGLNLSPAGKWDIMDGGSGHMGAWMKYTYSDSTWITSIPVITEPGTYTLYPLTSSTSNCYKIASPFSSNEFFVVEYRKRTGDFEETLPGEGLLVYRINTDFRGNANFDNLSVFDEVYIYRPGGTVTKNGMLSDAHFSSTVGRTVINDMTDPNCFLHDNTAGGLRISSVTAAGETISFYVGMESFEISAIVEPPEGGIVTGSGEYYAGRWVNLVATPAPGYEFVHWTEAGEVVSDDETYRFVAAADRSLTAHFELLTFTINTFIQPGNGGTVSGAGMYTYGETAFVAASSSEGFDFLNWTESGAVVSADPSYQFTVTSNRVLIANFEARIYEVAGYPIPLAGGSIAGGGSYRYGETATLSATPEPGYDFISWLENGIIYSHQAEITFTVNKDRSFLVHFLLLSALSDLPGTKKFEIYPNPTSGKLYIKSNRLDTAPCIIEVFNSTGTPLVQKKLLPDGVEELDLGNIAKGIYIVVISGENWYHTEKVIIR